LESVPADLREQMSNVEIVVEDEPPPGQPLLGLYQGVPLTRRSSSYGAVLPDKITIFRGPLQRLYGDDEERLRREVRRVVLHEIAHHFGISDERLIEIDRY
jgi:predicted Zn-dependent protease with MMP-like domain